MGRLPQIETEDPKGRLDVLLIRLVDRLVETRGDMTLRALHAKYKPYIHEVLHEWCGPVKIPGIPKPEPAPRRRVKRGRRAA